MSTAIAHEPVYGSPEWLADRRNYLGASDMPKIARVSPYGGPLDVYYEKRGRITAEETHAMKRGHWYEPAVAAEYADRFPDVALELSPTVAHPNFDWLRATPDRVVSSRIGRYLLEIKTVTPYALPQYGPDGSSEVPDDKLVQAQVQMLVTGAPLVHLAVAFGWEMRVYPIERDLETQQMLLELAHNFWFNHHLANVEPEPSVGIDSELVLKAKYSTHGDTILKASEAETKVIAAFAQAKADKADAEAREDALKRELMLIIGHNKAVDSVAGRVTWSETKGRTSIDTDGLVRHLNVPEEVLQTFTRTGAPFRTMRFYEPKAKK